MTRKIILGILLGSSLSSFAQQKDSMKTKMSDAATYAAVPTSDMWEFGINAGLAIMEGAIPYDPSFGIGLHLRKALDHTFSIRLDGVYLATQGSAGSNGPYPATYHAGEFIKSWSAPLSSLTGQVVISLNNGRWDAGLRKINPYLFVGGGIGNSDTKLTYTDGTSETMQINGRLASTIVPVAEGGVGIAFRVSDKFNIGIEEKFSTIFGKRAGVVDGFYYQYRDIFSYTNLRLNFNIGGGDKNNPKTLPLWWTGPADKMNADIAELKARPKFDPTDTDGDGVIDMFDKEPNTPAGARVDTHGVALDSDGDGVPDYRDKEPFSPPGYPVDKDGVAIVPKPAYLTEPEVNKVVTTKLAQWDASHTANAAPVKGIADWFLPMIHFDFNSSSVKESDFGNLHNVAEVMKANPSISVVVTGHTDKVSSEGYNEALSYKRAQAAIDHLVKKYNIDRSRLILNYDGKKEVLVNTKSANYMNRRVEFKVAEGETEMTAPARSMKSKHYKGNKNAGY